MGLRFHAPQSFLFIANYGWSLVRAPTEIAAAIVANGAFVAFFGWPLKRISGAMAGAALGLMMAGCYARIALAAAWAVTFMVAMAVQIRLGPLQLHIPRAFNKKKKKA